jgi:hypothetical protein
MTTTPIKPLGKKAYGSIPHLIGSRRGPGDHGVNDGQYRICCEKCRPGDTIIVQEKLDGSNVCVARVNGKLIALGRAGYPAQSSKYEQHQLFAYWVRQNNDLFHFLPDGWRISGEWLAQAHGTRYELASTPFVAFDIFKDADARCCYEEFADYCICWGVDYINSLPTEGPVSISDAMALLGENGHWGAVDPVEGAVWRVERNGKVDFLAKYVRPEKVDGCYLPEKTGGEPVWNWRP